MPISKQKTRRGLPRKLADLHMRPATQITTAPVSIGNSIRGSEPTTTIIKGGVRVRGRDFAFTVANTVAAATGWTLAGGIPLTPSAMPSTALRSYVQLYGKFVINSVTAHYITSSPTSQAGDIMFYYERDRDGPMVDWTNNSFLPYVLSDHNTVLGPQWMNHTALIDTPDGVNFTNYGLKADLNEDVCGSLFIFSKTSSANSPGYVLFDYDITFLDLSVNPRAGILPIARAQWFPTCFGKTTLAATASTTQIQPVIQGNTVAGTAAANPTGVVTGDIYKVVLDITNSTVSGVNAAWTNVTTANLVQFNADTTAIGVTIDDGFTLYSLYDGTNHNWHATLEGAITNTNKLYYGTTATITFNVCAMISLVYNKLAAGGQSSY